MTQNTNTRSRTSGRARGLLQPGFLAAVGVLLVAAVGLNAAVGAMRLHFKKLPVPLEHSLYDPEHGIPSSLGHWVQVSKDEPLDHTMLEALGTDEFVFRDYVNTNLVPTERVE